MILEKAVLQTLAEIGVPATCETVFKHIENNKYSESPKHSVNSVLSRFITKGDNRVKRAKGEEGGPYYYYLTEQEQAKDTIFATTIAANNQGKTTTKRKTYHERDLHILLSTYLHSTNVYAKTIFHEQSNNSDSHQQWTHPDMLGLQLLQLQSSASQSLLKAVSRTDMFKISSYELKKEINNDSELKRAFFQAVSNSSWANFGYLVAFEFSDTLQDEIARLNQSFGIGIIELDANPYQTKVLYPATYRELDFKTIDKLCRMNTAFESFIGHIESLVTSESKHLAGQKKELAAFCDAYFTNDADIEQYCAEKHLSKEDL